MSLKEDFLKIKTYEEYNLKRELFKELDYGDKEVRKHWGSLFPRLEKSGWENGVITEVYKEPPKKRIQQDATSQK